MVGSHHQRGGLLGIRGDGRQRPGFTLVELLVVMTIMAILMSLLLTAVWRVVDAAKKAKCSSNMKQVALAMHSYANARNQIFPSNSGVLSTSQQSVATAYPGLNAKGTSWLTQCLPYLDSEPLFRTIAVGQAVGYTDALNGIDNTAAARTIVPAFMCPADSVEGISTQQMLLSGGAFATTNYKAVAGSNWPSGGFKNRKKDHKPNALGGRNFDNINGLDYGDGIICRSGNPSGSDLPTAFQEIRDGMTRTFALGECIPEYCGWSVWFWFEGSTATCAIPLNYKKPNADPRANWKDWAYNYSFWSRHRGGANFALCDGSVQFVSETIDTEIYRGMATIDGQENVTLPP